MTGQKRILTIGYEEPQEPASSGSALAAAGVERVIDVRER
jgi:hypothetical protein